MMERSQTVLTELQEKEQAGPGDAAEAFVAVNVVCWLLEGSKGASGKYRQLLSSLVRSRQRALKFACPSLKAGCRQETKAGEGVKAADLLHLDLHLRFLKAFGFCQADCTNTGFLLWNFSWTPHSWHMVIFDMMYSFTDCRITSESSAKHLLSQEKEQAGYDPAEAMRIWMRWFLLHGWL